MSRNKLDNKSKKNTAKKKAVKKSTQYTSRRIPQKILEEALEVLKDESLLNDMLKQGSSCRPPIHMAGENQTLSHHLMLMLKDARNCLIKRDWINLAKLLSLFNPSSEPYYGFYIGLTAKYATMLLAYHDEKLLAMLSQSVLLENDHEQLFKKQTAYPKCEILEKN